MNRTDSIPFLSLNDQTITATCGRNLTNVSKNSLFFFYMYMYVYMSKRVYTFEAIFLKLGIKQDNTEPSIIVLLLISVLTFMKKDGLV